jgi:hypothetical protein
LSGAPAANNSPTARCQPRATSSARPRLLVGRHRLGRAEQRHRRIADELVDRRAVLESEAEAFVLLQ